MVLQITKPKTARPVTAPDHSRIFEHAQVTAADLRDAAFDASAKHIPRDCQRLQSLRGLAAQNPRLPVERDMFDVADPDPGLIQAELQGVMRESAVMLDAREPLLLGGGDQLAVTDQRSRRIAKRGQPQNICHISYFIFHIPYVMCHMAYGI